MAASENIYQLYQKMLKSYEKDDKKEDITVSANTVEENVTETDEPLNDFFSKLGKILKENKKEDSDEILQKVSEIVEDSEKSEDVIKNNITEEKSVKIVEESAKSEDVGEDVKDDSLGKFLNKLNNILVTNKNEVFKNSALQLIENLKNEKIVEEEKPKIEEKPVEKKPKVEEPLVKRSPKPLPKKSPSKHRTI